MNLFDIFLIITLLICSQFNHNSSIPLSMMGHYCVIRIIAIYFKDIIVESKKKYKANVLSFLEEELARLERYKRNGKTVVRVIASKKEIEQDDILITETSVEEQIEIVKSAIFQTLNEKPKNHFLFKRFI